MRQRREEAPMLFRSERLKRRLMASLKARLAKEREERLAAYLRSSRLGEGEEVSS